MVYLNSKEFKDSQMVKTLENIERRGHVYISGTYENKQSKLVVACLEHGQNHETTFSNYNRSRTGLPCCGKEQVSQKLTGRTFSLETLEKMYVANNRRPHRGGKPRRWRENHTYRTWKAKVSQLYNQECAITGQTIDNSGKIDIHHLYSAEDYPVLIFTVENGIPIVKDLHMAFHKLYRYEGNTIDQFLAFLLQLLNHQQQCQQSMPISSQAKPGGLEGSETRVYDPDRVMKLHERLESYKLFLQQQLEETETDTNSN